jgi:hypothetical protein
MKEIKNNNMMLLLAVCLILLAAITRFIPHPSNFTAVGAMALFSGAIFKDRKFLYLMPVVVMFLTDIILGFHFSMVPVYSCFAFTVWMGIKISKNQNIFTIGGASIISSVVFFLVTNLPLWYLDQGLYPNTLKGTFQSYTMALPFFQNQLLGDIFYNTLLFGIFHLVARRENVTIAQ